MKQKALKAGKKGFEHRGQPLFPGGSLVCSTRFAFHTRKTPQHQIKFASSRVLKSVRDSELRLEIMIFLCLCNSIFLILWFLKKIFWVVLTDFTHEEVQYQKQYFLLLSELTFYFRQMNLSERSFKYEMYCSAQLSRL